MNREQIEERLYQLDIILDQLFDESLNMSPDEGYKWYRERPELKEYQDLHRELKLIYDENDFDLHDISEVGDKMTLQDFVESCEYGGFIDYDGFGYYATETQESSIKISPSDVTNNKYRKDFPYIIWYNR